jgi:amidophosphoribosyltransferase
VFEHVYFARPDSKVFGGSVDRSRRALGRQLARECPAPGADVVFAVPDSSNSAALGFAEESGVPYELALIRNHYVGRTFIQPTQSGRDAKVKVKYNPVREIIEGKKVVMVDDSIVRGTTTRGLVSLVRAAGAREVHMRVSSAPDHQPLLLRHRHPAPRGAHRGADDPRGTRASSRRRLARLPLHRRHAFRHARGPSGYCHACFSGRTRPPFRGARLAPGRRCGGVRPAGLTTYPITCGREPGDPRSVYFLRERQG